MENIFWGLEIKLFKNLITGFLMKTIRLKILFICPFNKDRSSIASSVYKDDQRFEVKSAGLSKHAKNIISKELLEWADAVFVMEGIHLKVIQESFPDIFPRKKFYCLYIPDVFNFTNHELSSLVKYRFEMLYTKERKTFH